MRVTSETIIGEILDYDVGTAKYFMEIGMHCLGCPASRGESIEMACEIHGIDVDELVDMINKYGGKLPDAVGIPEEQLRLAAKSAVCKINIDSDSRLAMTAAVRKDLYENPGHFDPRQYLKPARDEMKKMYIHKIVEVLGSDGKA